MPNETCADNLARLGEMLAAASEYCDRCDRTVTAESRHDIEGAYNRIDTLRVHHAELSQKIEALEIRHRARLREFTH